MLAPSGRLNETLALLADAERALGSRGELLRRVQHATGLYFGELQALAVVAAGGRTPQAVVDATGQVPGAVDATIESLTDRGLLTIENAAPGVEPTLRVTPSGRVAVQRAEGVQVRLMDVVVSSLSADETERMREALRAVPDALPGRAPRRGE